MMLVSLNESSSERFAEPTRAESLAAALEQQGVGDGADRWVVHVLGVHTDGRHIWVQLAPRPDGNHSIVLRLSPTATVHHALAALATLPIPSRDCPPVVPVMCAV
jgi:hypothetical protein